MTKNPPFLIFEGAELSGKSFIMSQIYNHLEPKYNTGGRRLNGCVWFNTDVGIYGGKHSALVMERFIDIAEHITDRPVMFEKFHISDIVYFNIYKNQKIQYNEYEKRLKKLNAKIIFCSIDEDEALFEHRLKDRLNLYPHYIKIAQTPKEYIAQQQIYKQIIKKSSLPVLPINSSVLPNDKIIKDIINWIS